MKIIIKILRKMNELERSTMHGRGHGITPAKWGDLKIYIKSLAKVKEAKC